MNTPNINNQKAIAGQNSNNWQGTRGNWSLNDNSDKMLHGDSTRMKTLNAVKFNAEVNLDDPYEIAQFIETYGTTKGRSLANALGFKGRFATRAANALSNYAWNKHTAIACRTKGNIVDGQKYESICDKIYTQDINPLINCW